MHGGGLKEKMNEKLNDITRYEYSDILGWSVSRYDKFCLCRRQYYYDYYGKYDAEFPRFKKENPSGDFWAPGYLIMGGSQPPPARLIKDFIAQTRQRQGITKPIR